MTTFKEFFEFKLKDNSTEIEEEFIISEPALDIEYGPPKYCLLATEDYELTVNFECNCPVKPGLDVRIFSNPSITDNGTLFYASIPLTLITVYHDPTVTNDGTQIHQHVCGFVNVYDNFVFTARANYLIKMTPKVDSTKVSVLTE